MWNFWVSSGKFRSQTKQLVSFATEGVKNIVENNQVLLKQNQQELTTIKTLMNEKDNQLKALEDEVLLTKQELNNTQQSLVVLREELAEKIKDNQTEINWLEVRNNQQLSISSPQDYLVEQLQILNNQHEQLVEQKLTDQQLLAYKSAELKEYIKLANKLAERENSLNSELAILTNKLADYSRKIVELELTKISLKLEASTALNQQISLQGQLASYQKQRLAWETEKADAKESLRKWKELEADKVAIFNRTAFENAQLKSQIITLNQTIEQRDQIIKEGKKYVSKLEAKLANHEISLEL